MLSRKVEAGYVGVSRNTDDNLILIQVSDSISEEQSRASLTVEQAKKLSEKLTEQIIITEVTRLDEEPLSKSGAGKTVVGSSPTASALKLTPRNEESLTATEIARLTDYEYSRVRRMSPDELGRWREYGRVDKIQAALENKLQRGEINDDEFVRQLNAKVISVRRQLSHETSLENTPAYARMQQITQFVVEQTTNLGMDGLDWRDVRIHSGMVSGTYDSRSNIPVKFRIFLDSENNDNCFAGVIAVQSHDVLPSTWREARACYTLEEFKDVIGYSDQISSR